jgi:dGTPase
MRTREEYLERERSLLAPCAVRAAESRGRAHPEPEHPLRSPFERDRDRIIHSSAFRKLEYKTQVFVNHEGDYYRTRLTHTLEATQIARSLARFLRLNEDLAEALALVHDVGHAPFGHAGEDALQERMRAHGGFEHNLQTLRVVTRLESPYASFPGLNLTWEVREGIVRHSRQCGPGATAGPLAEFTGTPHPSLEAQLVDACDQLAYNAHDVDDGLTAGLITLQELDEVPLWRRLAGPEVRRGLAPRQALHFGVRSLINAQVTALAAEIEARIAAWDLASPEDVRRAPGPVAVFPAEMAEENAALRRFLRERVYSNYRVSRMSTKARRVLEALFRSYEEHPEQLPPAVARAAAGPDGLHRALCDYLAGLTDREALEEHRRLFDPLAT